MADKRKRRVRQTQQQQQEQTKWQMPNADRQTDTVTATTTRKETTTTKRTTTGQTTHTSKQMHVDLYIQCSVANSLGPKKLYPYFNPKKTFFKKTYLKWGKMCKCIY